MTKTIRIALTGNPDVGKTTLFNALTGSRQHVGNWSGVMVEKKTGWVSRNGYDIEIVDLPGTYSLTAYSVDEIVARDFILKEKPDVVVQVVDATNLERNLYLTTQLAELGVPVVIALNMADAAEARGDTIDREKLSALLEIPVVRTVGTRGDGIGALLDAVIREEEIAPCHERIVDYVDYGVEVEAMIASLIDLLLTDRSLPERYPLRWLAVRLLEGDGDVLTKIPGGLGFDRLQDFFSLIDSEGYRAVMEKKRYETIATILSQVMSSGLGDPGASCRFSGCYGGAGGRLVVEYVLTEKGRKVAEKFSKMGCHTRRN